jgi:hypothetical protein
MHEVQLRQRNDDRGDDDEDDECGQGPPSASGDLRRAPSEIVHREGLSQRWGSGELSQLIFKLRHGKPSTPSRPPRLMERLS